MSGVETPPGKPKNRVNVGLLHEPKIFRANGGVNREKRIPSIPRRNGSDFQKLFDDHLDLEVILFQRLGKFLNN